MTNNEFLRKYGVKEMLDLVDSTYIRLEILKINKQIGAFKISKRKRMVYFYLGGTTKQYEIAKVYTMSDKEVSALWHKEKNVIA